MQYFRLLSILTVISSAAAPILAGPLPNDETETTSDTNTGVAPDLNGAESAEVGAAEADHTGFDAVIDSDSIAVDTEPEDEQLEDELAVGVALGSDPDHSSISDQDPNAAAGPNVSIFRGSSILIAPGNNQYPSKVTYDTACFYSYSSDQPPGYVSFGWFLGGDPYNTNYNQSCTSAPVLPNGYGWWEYSADVKVVGKAVSLLATNYLTAQPFQVNFEVEYVVFGTWVLGPLESQTLVSSYFNETQGQHAVGTRHYLTQGSECEDAWKTMQAVVSYRNVPFKGQLINPCTNSTQVPRRLF